MRNVMVLAAVLPLCAAGAMPQTMASLPPPVSARAYVDSLSDMHASELRRHTGIPSIAVARKGGRLWATYYGGITPGEDANNYVSLATSSDNGDTWKVVLVADPDGPGMKRAFDPEVWVSPDGRLLWTFSERLCKRPSENGKSGDFGDPDTDRLLCVELDAEAEPSRPFPQPREIAKGVMMCKPAVLADGTWLFPVSHWYGEPSACFYASSDGGRTFHMRGGVSVPKELRLFDEHVVAQLRNGDLLTFIRSGWGKPFLESASRDGGRTWDAPRKARFEHTSSRLFLMRLASGNLLLVKHGPIDKDVGRSELRAFISEDDGATWLGGLLLDERQGVSYPDGDQAKDGTIYLVYDRDRTKEQEVLFAAFTEEDAKAGRIVDGRSRLRRTITRRPVPLAVKKGKERQS